MNEDQGASAEADRAGRASPEPQEGLGHSATIPSAIIAPMPEQRRIVAIARIATPGLDALVGPYAWSASEVAARHGYLYGWYAALPVALEFAAKLADEWRDENKAGAARARSRGARRQALDDDCTALNMAEMLDGAAIECNAIAGEIRRIASVIEARQGRDREDGLGAQHESAVAEPDAQDQPS